MALTSSAFMRKTTAISEPEILFQPNDDAHCQSGSLHVGLQAAWIDDPDASCRETRVNIAVPGIAPEDGRFYWLSDDLSLDYFEFRAQGTGRFHGLKNRHQILRIGAEGIDRLDHVRQVNTGLQVHQRAATLLDLDVGL